MEMTFEQLQVGDKFKSIGKVTRSRSLYTWTKITETSLGGVSYNASSDVLSRVNKRTATQHVMYFHGDDEVEICH